MQVIQLIEKLSERFDAADLCFGHGTDNPRDEACYLVFAALGLDWQHFDAEMLREISGPESDMLDQLARQRIEDRLPTAYLVGVAWFAGIPFHSDKRALVPRSPIAELIENHFQPLLNKPPSDILDLCCGGGCIGIAAALQFPEANVELVDISPEALQLAAENVQLHHVQSRVHTVLSDLFQELSGRRYDLIVSNPPYVGTAEFTALPQEFRHEPELGLLSGDEGLQIPLRILLQAADYLEDQGVLVLEVGYSKQTLQDRCPGVPFLWLEFEHGGEGVLMLTRSQLLEYRDRFV